MKISSNTTRLRWAAAVLLLANIGGTSASQHSDRASEPVGEQRKIESEISALVQEIIRINEINLGSATLRTPAVSYDPSTKAVTIDLGRSAVPKEHTPTFDEDLLLISQRVSDAISPDVPVDVKIVFDGSDIYEYFPEDRGPIENPGSDTCAIKGKPTEARVALIPARHGNVLANSTKAAQA